MIRKHAEMKVEVREEMRGGVGAVTVREMFTPGEITAPTRLCATLELAPGASIGSHRHDGEDEVYVITAGSGVLDDGITESEVTAGDAVLTGNGESHSIRNTGDGVLEVIAVIMLYPKVDA
jgi:mannose-6-phosphate isomerase-like protein (cupin superfamily)